MFDLTAKKAAFIGIDPGKTGALALMGMAAPIEVVDFQNEHQAVAVLRRWDKEHALMLAALERVASRPGQGVRSVFTFGTNFGMWRGILAALEIAWEEPAPAQWQKGIVKKSDGGDSKERALTVARRLFPGVDLHRKKDHNRADALLMAYWCRMRALALYGGE